MKSHIDILLEETKMCMCEVEKKASEFFGFQIIFETDGNLYIYSNEKPFILDDKNFKEFLKICK